jgi:hypothetical protein
MLRRVALLIGLAACQASPAKSTATDSASAASGDSTVRVGGTNLQRFSVKTGAVLIKGFQEVGSVRGQLETAIIAEAREITDASDGTRTDGITLEVKSNTAYEKASTSYIDYDEIESLIRGLDYVAGVDKTATKLTNIQADYTTRGAFRISSFSEAEGKMSLAVHSGVVGGTTAYLSLAQAAELKGLIEKAKATVEAARPTKAKS